MAFERLSLYHHAAPADVSRIVASGFAATDLLRGFVYFSDDPPGGDEWAAVLATPPDLVSAAAWEGPDVTDRPAATRFWRFTLDQLTELRSKPRVDLWPDPPDRRRIPPAHPDDAADEN